MITVKALVERSEFDLQLRAGAAGAERLVTWAHAVDLPDPWNWVSAGDLMMTTGDGMPADPRGQAAWIDQLADAQVSAVVIAPREGAPDVTPGLLATAEERGLPVLGAGFDLEFARLARAVIESALQSQRDRLAAGQRLFESYASGLRDKVDLTGQLRSLGRRLSWNVSVRDGVDGPLLAGDDAADSATAITLDVPGRSGAAIEVVSTSENVPVDPLLVHYLAGLVGIELERQAIARDDERRDGAELLASMLDGTVDLATARPVLERRGLLHPIVLMAIEPAGHARRGLEDFHHAPELRTIHPLIWSQSPDLLLVVLPHDEHLVAALRRVTGLDSRAGVSGAVTAGGGIGEAFHEARLALARAKERGEGLSWYAQELGSSGIGPSTVAEARKLVDDYLGPLLNYDIDHDSKLVQTLEAFLGNDGSYKATAEGLHIHRQTLVYRLATIERLTGLKPSSTTGTTHLWLALRAGRNANLL